MGPAWMEFGSFTLGGLNTPVKLLNANAIGEEEFIPATSGAQKAEVAFPWEIRESTTAWHLALSVAESGY